MTIIIQYFITHYGYKLGRESITGILQSGMMQSIIYAANILGLIMMGALSSSYITITTPLAFTMAAGNTIELQSILDGVIPNVLPLVAVFAIYFYMQKKGPRYNRILLAIIVISFICAALGILVDNGKVWLARCPKVPGQLWRGRHGHLSGIRSKTSSQRIWARDGSWCIDL